jgi:hypothetical protein
VIRSARRSRGRWPRRTRRRFRRRTLQRADCGRDRGRRGLTRRRTTRTTDHPLKYRYYRHACGAMRGWTALGRRGGAGTH